MPSSGYSHRELIGGKCTQAQRDCKEGAQPYCLPPKTFVFRFWTAAFLYQHFNGLIIKPSLRLCCGFHPLVLN